MTFIPIGGYFKHNERLEELRKSGFTEENFKDVYWGIRSEAYEALGFTEKALKDKDDDIRLNAYNHLGFTEEALKDKDLDIRSEATLYFISCQEIIENEHFKTRFTPEEAALLEFNGLVVNKKIIIGE